MPMDVTKLETHADCLQAVLDRFGKVRRGGGTSPIGYSDNLAKVTVFCPKKDLFVQKLRG